MVPDDHSWHAAPILGGNRTVGILQGIHALINPRLDAVYRSHTAVPQTYVYNIERLGIQVFGKLQILIESHTIAGTVAPVYVLMARTFLDRTDSLLPVESILRRFLSLYVATAREADELRMDVIEKLSQIRAQAFSRFLKVGGKRLTTSRTMVPFPSATSSN